MVFKVEQDLYNHKYFSDRMIELLGRDAFTRSGTDNDYYFNLTENVRIRLIGQSRIDGGIMFYLDQEDQRLLPPQMSIVECLKLSELNQYLGDDFRISLIAVEDQIPGISKINYKKPIIEDDDSQFEDDDSQFEDFDDE